MHPFLHPEFTLTPPRPPPNLNGDITGHGGAGSSTQPLTAAEQEMGVIRRRRETLKARSAQVQPAPVQQPPPPIEPSTSYYPGHQQPLMSPLPQHINIQPQQYGQSPMHTTNPFTAWGNTDLYAPGAAFYNPNSGLPMSLSTSASGSPFGMGTALAPFDDNTNNLSSRRSTDAFDTGLARFSLDPAKIIHPEKIAKKQPPEGGSCHGCSVTVTAEWRRGPDGPRSLCNACGVSPCPSTIVIPS